MSYSKVTFSAIVPLSIANLNMLGSQYDDMKSVIVNHEHTAYYNKTESLKYVYADNDGSGSGANASTIDGFTKAQLSASVPTGLMIWYHGALNVLSGWHLADGSAGTRNCLNKYIIGADAGTFLNTGGNDYFTPIASLTINNHQISLAEMPIHYHTWIETVIYNTGWPYSIGSTLEMGGIGSPSPTSSTKNTGYQGSDQAHGHTGSTITFNDVENRPNSKAVYVIQKI